MLKVGDSVRVKPLSVEEATALQKGHGGWSDSMAPIMGTTGTVASIDGDGDVKVNGKLWAPKMIERVDPVKCHLFDVSFFPGVSLSPPTPPRTCFVDDITLHMKRS